MKRIIGLIGLCCLMQPVFSQSGVYRWTDENGRVHYGDSVPSGMEGRQLDPDNSRVSTIPVPDHLTPEAIARDRELTRERWQQEALEKAQQQLKETQRELAEERTRPIQVIRETVYPDRGYWGYDGSRSRVSGSGWQRRPPPSPVPPHVTPPTVTPTPSPPDPPAVKPSGGHAVSSGMKQIYER